jgi:hypothetical protein
MRSSNSRALFLLAPGIFAFVVTTSAAGQQTAPATALPPMPAMQANPNTNLVSPEVHPDGTITFRLWAPDAREVKLSSEGEESVPGETQEQVMAAMKGVPLTKILPRRSLSVYIHRRWRQHNRSQECSIQ